MKDSTVKRKPIYSFSEALAATNQHKVSDLLAKLTPSERGQVTKHINKQIADGIRSQVSKALADRERELGVLMAQYRENLNLQTDDIRRVKGNLHSDRLTRTAGQLDGAMTSFKRLIAGVR